MNTNNPFNKEITETQTDIPVYPNHGRVFNNRYRLIDTIGTGGMGRVYKAIDEVASEVEGKEKYVAIKVLLPQLSHNRRAVKRLQREALRAQELRHEHIVGVYNFDSEGDWTYLLMEWLDGESLEDTLDDELDGLALETVTTHLKTIGKALSYAHNKGVIHRDIKPNNMILTKEQRLVLIDFGLSQEAKQSLSRLSANEQQSSGTVVYMPPEALVAGHPATIKDDIYGLAATIYELLTGYAPFIEAACWNRTSTTPLPHKPPQLDESQWQVLSSALAFNPDDRPDSVASFVNDFCSNHADKDELQVIIENPQAWQIKWQDEKAGFVDTNGLWKISAQFDDIRPFAANGLAAVNQGHKWGFINCGGNWVIKPDFEHDYAESFAPNGLALLSWDFLFGFINAKGEWAIKPKFEAATSFNESGLALVVQSDKKIYIDKQGNYVKDYEGYDVHGHIESFLAEEQTINHNLKDGWNAHEHIKSYLIATEQKIDHYLIHNDGTVTDTRNGLMWQRFSVGETWTDAGISGEAKQFTWDEAMAIRDNFAGYSDWRLPTIDELATLIYCSSGEPDFYPARKRCKGDFQKPIIKTTVFPMQKRGLLGWLKECGYWSSSPHANYNNYAWYVSFVDGLDDNSSKSLSSYVRLVRGGQ